jgi:outer membrane protein assembly factor BamB
VVADAGAGKADLVALDASSGERRWTLRLPPGVAPGQAPVIANGRAYLTGTSTSADTLVVVKLARHAVARVVPLPTSSARRPSIDGAGNVYVTACGSITKLDKRGTVIHSEVIDDTEGCGEGQSTPLANGLIYVVEFDDAYVFDTQTLAIVADLAVGGFVGSPIIADGKLLIGGDLGISTWNGSAATRGSPLVREGFAANAA